MENASHSSATAILSIDHFEAIQRITEIISQPVAAEQRYLKVAEIVKSATNVDRIAILVYDPDGIMRFKASIGLSHEYRDVVEGHSPWSREVRNPKPVLVEDAQSDTNWTKFLSLFQREGIRSLAFIPLTSHGKVVGKFMLYYDTPHVYGADEITLAQTIAALVGFAIERNAHLEQLRKSNEEVNMILESITDAFYALDRDWKFTYVNQRARELWGITAEVIGRDIWELFPQVVGTAGYDAHVRAMREGVPVQLEVVSPIFHRWIDLNIDPNSKGLSVYFRDIDERKRTEKALAEVQRRSIFLAEASNILTSSLDYETTLQAVAELAVPELSDGCTVQILDEEGAIKTVAVAHIDPGRADVIRQISKRYPLPGDRGPRKVIETGVAELKSEVKDSDLKAIAKDGEHLNLLRQREVHSYICVPLVARGRTLGALSFTSDSPNHPYSENDLVLARALASRAALAVDNARLYQESRQSQELILSQLKEKEILIKEIHHRVKNNLQIISSLLNLQAIQSNIDAAPLLKELQNRVRTMAMIHEKLYQSDLSHVDLGDYIRDLSFSLFQSFGAPADRIKLHLNCECVLVDLDKAVPCGLIVNEILSNSLKHAFPDDRCGDIQVDFHKENDRFRLQIQDNGTGIPQSISLGQQDSLGLRLISMLVRQLNGEMRMNASCGTQFDITFK